MGAYGTFSARARRISSLRSALRAGQALFWLSRPVNLLLIVATSGVALLLLWRDAGIAPAWGKWTLMVVSTVAVAIGGYWLNDLYDQPIDRINRPKRALRVARVGQRNLLAAVFAVWGIALLLAGLLPLPLFLLHIAVILALAWYARFGKRNGLLGNILIAALTGLVPWEVMLLHRTTAYAVDWMIPLAIAFNFVRELVKDAEDIPGDRLYKVASLPNRLSPQRWQTFLGIAWLLLLPMALLPAVVHKVAWGKLPLLYLLSALIGVGVPWAWGWRVRWDYGRMSRLLKLAMAGGIGSLVFL
ncbi:MAG: UbiA family prenyltransferase [Bacteroidia bacterium]|nr:UbiA family prenyltransferase [Bacteroidia bacterium]